MAAKMVLFSMSMLALPVVASDASTTDYVGWQDSPHRRGTWDIILSCGTTIFACTWSIQHLNVPGTHDSPVKKTMRSCQWMAITILFPEFIMAHAFFELSMAVEATKLIEATSKMTMKYSSLVRMLFFRGRVQNSDPEHCENNQRPEWSLAHSYFANMGGLLFEHTEEQERIRFPLTALQYAREIDLYSCPEITEDDIKDKGKQDYFAKAIAILQICWLILSLITRTSRGLPFSQFETLTLGLAVCGVAIYIIYWYKPQGVGVPMKIAKRGGYTVPQFSRTYDSLWDVLSNSKKTLSPQSVHRIRNDNIPPAGSDKWNTPILVLAFLSAVFGCLHVIAWNFEFPSEVEKLLWRIATIMSIVVPGLGMTTILLAQFTTQDGDPREFMRNFLYLLREFSWLYHDSDAVSVAMTKLEAIYNMDPSSESADARCLYRQILTTSHAGSSRTGDSLWPEMVKFVGKEKPYDRRNSVPLPKEFLRQFSFLVQLMNDEGPKRLIDCAKTNVFPRRTLIPTWVNLSILYATNLIYIASRLMIVALALASLRSMPGEVYITTWTKNIPAIQ